MRGPIGRTLIVGAAGMALVVGACTSDSAEEPDDSVPADDNVPADDSPSDAPAGPPRGEISGATVSDSADTLDEIVGTVMDETGVPGVAVAVVHDDAVIYEQGYGVREVGQEALVDPDTLFQIASLTKPISSTVMSGLVGDGVFQWDDPVVEYFPELQLSDPWVTDHVTFADLFSHRSGLPGGPAGNDLEAIGFDRETILERLSLVPLDGFRDTYSYSNWAMTLGGEAAATAAGSDWETVSETVLFEPAGMTDTSMRYEDLVANDNRADLHIPHGDGEWGADDVRNPQPQAPAGGASSNVGDLAQWMRLQLNAGELDGTQIIDSEALAQSHVPHITSRPPNPPDGGQPGLYALGWSISTEFGGYTTWGHAGAFSNGASTMAKLVPAEDLGIVVLTNGAPVGAPEAISDAYIDYLLTGENHIDEFLATWSDRMSGVYGEPLDLGPAPTDPAPMAADEAYAGTYANDYVGEVTIGPGTEPGTLEMTIGPQGTTYTLDHREGDLFVYQHERELDDAYIDTATFELIDGQAQSLTLSAVDGAGLGTLNRT